MTSIQQWIDNFKWESKDQLLGFLNFLQWWRKYDVIDPGIEICETAAYFIQKDLESNEWWRETVADQVNILMKQIGTLQRRVEDLEHGSR